jgi:hypothetical protein
MAAEVPPPITLCVVYHNGETVTGTRDVTVSTQSTILNLVQEAITTPSTIANAVVTTHGFTKLYHPGPEGQSNNNRSLHDCHIDNGDIITVFQSETAYDKAWQEQSVTIRLEPDNEQHRGKFKLEKVTEGNFSYFKAVEDPNGDDLFSNKNVFQVVDITMRDMQRSKLKYILLRDESGNLRSKRLRKTVGKRIRYVLQMIHYNLDAASRYPAGAREFMIRGIMYKHQDVFTKDGNFHNEINHVLELLSEGLRIRVGDTFVSIPVRGFNVASETKGKYDGPLSFVYKKNGVVVASFDCISGDDAIANTINNRSGYSVPDYYPRAKDGMGTGSIDFDSVEITTNAKYILVCEDGSIFKYLRQIKIWELFPVILVCAHGRPDKDTVAFVHMLHHGLNLPV